MSKELKIEKYFDEESGFPAYRVLKKYELPDTDGRTYDFWSVCKSGMTEESANGYLKRYQEYLRGR